MNRKMILSIATASVLALAMTACGNRTTETRKTSVTESRTTEAITEASASDSTEEARECRWIGQSLDRFGSGGCAGSNWI